MPVRGLQETLRKIRQFSEVIQEDVRDTVEKYTLAIEREAVRNAPGAGDRLKTTWGSQKNNTGINQLIFSEFDADGLVGRVLVSDQHGPLPIYVEMGTGRSAAALVPTLPPEFQEIARRYYINGKGTLIAQPFLLPAFFGQQFLFLKELQQVLKNHGIPTKLIP